MTRNMLLGIAVLVFTAVAVAACDDDENGVAGDPTPTRQSIATPTQEPAGEPTATPQPDTTGEIPEGILEAINEYILAGNIPSLASGTDVVLPEDCAEPAEICVWEDMPNAIGETEASVGIFVNASDEFWALDLELQGGVWTVTGHTDASGLGPPEIPGAILQAIDAYVLAGNIPSLASGMSVELPEDCDQPAEICVSEDMPSVIGETEASVGIFVNASDEFWALDLELQGGVWTVTGHTDASTLGPAPE